MSCCGSEAGLIALLPDARAAGEEVLLASRIVADGVRQTDLSVPAIHCGACIRTVEKALGGLAGVESARVNLSTKRVTVRWRADGAPPPLIATLEQAGFQAHLFDFEPDSKDGARSELVRALAVAGFAASNIMLLSVSIWAGAEAETRNLFHWLSAIIALPALAYSGRVFFRSAWQAVRHGRTNMDVPISAWCAAGLRHEFLRNGGGRPARLFRRGCLPAVRSAGGTHARPHGARARPACGKGAGAAFCAWRVRTAGGWHAALSSDERDSDRNGDFAGGRRTRARRCDRDQGGIGNGRLAGVGRARAGPGGRRLGPAGRNAESDGTSHHYRDRDGQAIRSSARWCG